MASSNLWNRVIQEKNKNNPTLHPQQQNQTPTTPIQEKKSDIANLVNEVKNETNIQNESNQQKSRFTPSMTEALKKEEEDAAEVSLKTAPTLATADLQKNQFIATKTEIQETLTEEIPLETLKARSNEEGFQKEVKKRIKELVFEKDLPFTKEIKEKMVEDIYNDVLGFGPIQVLIDDPTISEIMVNRKDQIYVERKGKLVLSNVVFDDDQHIMHVIDKILTPLNRHIDEQTPYVDARLPDGSRVNAIIPPLAIKGPCITIRKFSKDPLQVKDLIKFGAFTPQVAEFLEACVKARLNILISGGTGSGKTTLLNVMSSFIPDNERIVTVEDAAELQLRQDHVVTLEARPAGITGTGAVPIRTLVANCLRMRPDRIIVGECRGGEALDMLQAMNTGHDGSMTTGHANTPRDMLSRLETMVLMAGMELPIRAIREQIASAINVIIQQARLRDGSRKIINITEVQKMEGDVIVLQDIFEFKQEGFTPEGKIIGDLVPTGVRPLFMENFEAMNIKIDNSIFYKRT